MEYPVPIKSNNMGAFLVNKMHNDLKWIQADPSLSSMRMYKDSSQRICRERVKGYIYKTTLHTPSKKGWLVPRVIESELESPVLIKSNVTTSRVTNEGAFPFNETQR